jgi:muramoyltetrapeptide carboxypeptidase
MKFPPFLIPGDHVAIVSPAGFINEKIVERGAEILRAQGFIVKIGLHACGKEGVFAGSDPDRSADMQKALDDKSIKAVFFSRGGYGSIRTHANLNWSSFFKKPKWLIGFSDITVFHSYLSNHTIASVHGVMTAWFQQDNELTDSFIEMLALLRGEKLQYNLAPHPLNRLGEVSGTLIGGNLSILQSLRGTPLDVDPKGKILFIEDIDEHHYHIDRMMLNLKTGGVLKNLSGLIVGYFTAITDGEAPFEKSSEEIIKEAVSDYGYPVLFGFPAGHELPNKPLLLGGNISLKVTSEQVTVNML